MNNEYKEKLIDLVEGISNQASEVLGSHIEEEYRNLLFEIKYLAGYVDALKSNPTK